MFMIQFIGIYYFQLHQNINKIILQQLSAL